jgi:hypothetical protein
MILPADLSMVLIRSRPGIAGAVCSVSASGFA